MNINKFLFTGFIFSSIILISCGNSNNNDAILKKMACTFTFRFKSTYEVGEKFTSTGIIVKDENSKEELKDYTFSIEEDYEFKEKNDNFVVQILKENYVPYEFSLVIKEKEEIFEDTNEINLSLYNINDFHGSFSQSISTNEMGMSTLGEFLINQKEKNPYTLITSSGDMWQGGIESNKTKGNIISEAMNIIGFDAMAIGNHEFDWDEEAIIKNVEIMDFPLLNSNIFYKNSSTRPDYLTPSTLINKGNLKIGLIGSIAKSCEDDILKSVVDKFTFNFPKDYYLTESNKLREAGADIIILLAHDGNFDTYYNATETSSTFNKPYADVVFLGHDHNEKSKSKNNVPLVEAYSNGRSIANVELKLEKNEDVWSVSSSSTKFYSLNIGVSEDLKNSDIDNLVEKYKEVIGDVSRVICTFSKSYNRYGFLDLVNAAIIEYINGETSKSDIKVQAAIHNYSGIRVNEVGPGEFTYEDLIKACPFSNNITAIKVNEMSYESLLNQYPSVEITKFDTSLGYAWIGTINYVSEQLEPLDTRSYPPYIAEVVESYLTQHDGEF